jgi:hypothetical protein
MSTNRMRRALLAGLLVAGVTSLAGCSASLDARVGSGQHSAGFKIGASVGATVDGQDYQPVDSGGRTHRNLYPFERGRR